MNTIHEGPNDEIDTNNKQSKLNSTSVASTMHISNATSTYSANGSSSTNGQSDDKTKGGATANTNGTTTTTTTINGSTTAATSTATLNNDYAGDMKIIDHIKNIERINEKRRRIFLNNTISEEYSSIDEKTETNNTSGVASTTAATAAVNGKNGETLIFNEKHTHIREEELVEGSTNSGLTTYSTTSKYTIPLKSPTTPPPKPPMLSRTRSLGVGDGGRSPITPSFVSPPLSPLNTFFAGYNASSSTAAEQQKGSTGVTANTTATTTDSTASVSKPSTATTNDVITAATITTVIVPEPVKVTTVQLKAEATVEENGNTPVLRKVERPASLSPHSTPKQISSNHYERLVEELKCPGCACPMKAPILLCSTGHSICEQCTRILMLCPLCKEPFTTIRSLTVEALCSKAHFRCSNASGGCTVRLQLDLLSWHEKQCIFKPMKCFMGRVWGDCQWSGREAYWKDHLEKEHGNKVFTTETIDLIWNMGANHKLGYYVFEIFDEMFNFYEIHDKERILFTMACTSTVKEKKHNYAFEVTILHQDNEALAITQKYPVHSEYDADILADGTCVSIPLSDLAKFIDEDKMLHYRLRILEVKTSRKQRNLRYRSPANTNVDMHPTDFQQTQIQGVNLKSVPVEVIVTRKLEDIPYADNSSLNKPSQNNGSMAASDTEGEEAESVKFRRKLSSDSEEDPEFEAFIAKKWGTPQLHFNRKFLQNNSNENSSNGDAASKSGKRFETDDRVSISSTSTTYKKRMTNSLRKSFRSLKSATDNLPFFKKSAEKNNSQK